nr:MAG TPA: hypothetical protein [Bacteriophage sp.]
MVSYPNFIYVLWYKVEDVNLKTINFEVKVGIDIYMNC